MLLLVSDLLILPKHSLLERTIIMLMTSAKCRPLACAKTLLLRSLHATRLYAGHV